MWQERGWWEHVLGLNPAAVLQERQNIIRYWLENLRAKQGESLHNIHFLEGQPISEYGTAQRTPVTACPHPHAGHPKPPQCSSMLGPCRDAHGGGLVCVPTVPSLTLCPAAQSRSWRPAASSSRSSHCTSRGSSSGS